MNIALALLLICTLLTVFPLITSRKLASRSKAWRAALHGWIAILAVAWLGYVLFVWPPWLRVQTIVLSLGARQHAELAEQRNLEESDMVHIPVEIRYGNAYIEDLPIPQTHIYANLPGRDYLRRAGINNLDEASPRLPVISVSQEWRRDWLLLSGEVVAIVGIAYAMTATLGLPKNRGGSAE